MTIKYKTFAGQTQETLLPETENALICIQIIAAINLILLIGLTWLDTPNGSRQKFYTTPANDSQRESILLSPQTPQPYVDYLVRTIDETPYYQRGRRFDPQYSY